MLTAQLLLRRRSPLPIQLPIESVATLETARADSKTLPGTATGLPTPTPGRETAASDGG